MLMHLLWAAVVVYAVYTVADVARLFAPVRAETTLPPPPVEVPEDLVAVANQERESWAQEKCSGSFGNATKTSRTGTGFALRLAWAASSSV